MYKTVACSTDKRDTCVNYFPSTLDSFLRKNSAALHSYYTVSALLHEIRGADEGDKCHCLSFARLIGIIYNYNNNDNMYTYAKIVMNENRC